MADTDTITDKAREDFDRKVRERDLLGYWMIPSRSEGYREPTPGYGPYLWNWETLNEVLHEAIGVIPQAEAWRRFIGFQHPDIKMGTTPNMMMGAQLLDQGEYAPCHRHTMDAVRFVTIGDGSTCTVVEGEEFPMARGDLVTTPNWSWHDHVSGGKEQTLWIDVAMAPLIVHFGIGFAEPHQADAQEVIRPKGWSGAQFGPLRPKTPEYSKTSRRPPYRYTWEDTRAMLDKLAEGAGDPFDAVSIRYADPLTGGPTLPTVDCEMMLLRPGEVTRAHRHTPAVIYHVFEGEGVSVIAGERFEWKRGDTFVVPTWAWHHHENDAAKEALLFSINDSPIMNAFCFDREEAAE